MNIYGVNVTQLYLVILYFVVHFTTHHEEHLKGEKNIHLFQRAWLNFDIKRSNFFFLSSHTFQMVQDNSEKVWKFHRYSLVYEYYDRPTIVPPFIIVNHIFRGMRWILNYFCGIFSYHNQLSEYILYMS